MWVKNKLKYITFKNVHHNICKIMKEMGLTEIISHLKIWCLEILLESSMKTTIGRCIPLTITCSKSTIEKLEKGVKYVQS